ncbi:hypothetical protein [Catellatospora sichuanensis]|uniref:hypothetical protein n=1 Tax=Catellatospora sichuanensis TaxID=1969805 RepID=UPI0011822C31|nr:hypothetical protein [Catellatospora sichuanensis]
MIKYYGGRRLAVLGGVLALAAAGVLAPSRPADAATMTFVTASTWAHTDSRDKNTPYIDVTAYDMPVGSWRDDAGKHHKSRAYFTYDLSAYRGKTISAAAFAATETAANDCDKQRSLELWRTSPVSGSTTWAAPPQELARLAGFDGPSCPPRYLRVDVLDLVRDSLAAGQTSLTLALRVPEEVEGNLHYGRRVRNTGISITANAAPGAPTQLTVANQSCGVEQALFIPTATPTITAWATDPDVAPGNTIGDPIMPTFAVWPADEPEKRVEWTTYRSYAPRWVSGTVPSGVLEQGRTYVAAVRAADDDVAGPWSAECRFTVDRERPSQPPLVSSVDYPNDGQWTHGGPGLAGDFTFSANGVADVAGYRYGIGGAYQYVAAPSLGAAVTVPITPTRDGYQTLYVYSVDRAGNSSSQVSYNFIVRRTAPMIEDADPEAWAGDPHHLTFRPNMDDVVSYTYRLDDGPDQTVAAAADGTAQVVVTPSVQGSTVYVRSTTATGLLSGENWRQLSVWTAPEIISTDFPMDGTQGLPVGTKGHFTFKPRMHGVVEYTYQFNRYQEDEQPAQTVAAGPDGSVTLPFTATRAGYNTLDVSSRTADGFTSEESGVAFYPASIAPGVESAVYPNGIRGGGIGMPGTFVFTPAVPEVVEYVYRFDDGPEQVIAAAPDGTASVEWTPRVYNSTYGGWYSLLVQSRSADGLLSDPAYHSIAVNGLEPLISATDGVVGQPQEITFTAQLAGTTEFEYRIGYEGEIQRVAAGPDGKATVTFTPEQQEYWLQIEVRSFTADGLVSGYTWHSIQVTAP